jgi:lysozyme
MTELEGQLIRHEGTRHFPYPDPLKPEIITIGIGRNLSGKGLTDDEIWYLFQNDIDECYDDLKDIFNSMWSCLPEHRQRVLLDMRFNLGHSGFLKFRNLIAAVKEGRHDEVPRHMMDSVWFGQVGTRGIYLVALWKNGGGD